LQQSAREYAACESATGDWSVRACVEFLSTCVYARVHE